jgi:hypothetical protein
LIVQEQLAVEVIDAVLHHLSLVSTECLFAKIPFLIPELKGNLAKALDLELEERES